MVEIRFGSGGQDAKNFVSELGSIYLKYAKQNNLYSEILESSDGSMTLLFSGNNVWNFFINESGKHTVQRCPDNERGSRRHSSVVSVGVLPLLTLNVVKIQEKDIETICQTGSGSGGQNQNKVASAVRMKHVPTGLSVFINGRDQHQNKKRAYEILSGRVQDFYYNQQNEEYAKKRKSLLGDSGRGGSKRTWNFYKGFITDHSTGKQTYDVKSVLKGSINLLR